MCTFEAEANIVVNIEDGKPHRVSDYQGTGAFGEQIEDKFFR